MHSLAIRSLHRHSTCIAYEYVKDVLGQALHGVSDVMLENEPSRGSANVDILVVSPSDSAFTVNLRFRHNTSSRSYLLHAEYRCEFNFV